MDHSNLIKPVNNRTSELSGQIMSTGINIQRAIPKITVSRRLLFGLLLQAVLPAISLYIAMLLRLDLDHGRVSYIAFVIGAPVLIGLRLIALVYFKVHTGLWRYVSVPDLIGIAKATTASTIVFSIIGLILIDPLYIPRSVYLI